jgi:hypothetical protein
MLIETVFCIALIAVSRTIAKIHDRRRDVLYGPYLRCAPIDAAYSSSGQHH